MIILNSYYIRWVLCSTDYINTHIEVTDADSYICEFIVITVALTHELTHTRDSLIERRQCVDSIVTTSFISATYCFYKEQIIYCYSDHTVQQMSAS